MKRAALTFNFDGAEVVLTREDLLIDMAQTEGYVSEGDNTVTVVLDTNLTPELDGGRLRTASWSARSRPCEKKPASRSWTISYVYAEQQ